MLAGPAFLAEALVLVDVVDARAVHAWARLALVDLCSSKCNTASCSYLAGLHVLCLWPTVSVVMVLVSDKGTTPISQLRPV